MYIAADGQVFFDRIRTYLTQEEFTKVEEAFMLARQEHGDEPRKSGELFFTHPLTVAHLLAEYRLDAPTLIAALLHDVVEDTRVSVEQIQDQFGKEIARLVDGLTKFQIERDESKKLALEKSALQAHTLRKLFDVMVDDVRVGIIKLFDRYHNMLTIKATKPESQRKKAHESLAVYAPLANRLGMWGIKNTLQEIALEILYPDLFNDVKESRLTTLAKREAQFADIKTQLGHHLTQHGIPYIDIFVSITNIAPLCFAVQQNTKKFEQFDNEIYIVVIVDDDSTCYQALGHVHSLWRPVRGSFDDYIARPLENLYSSLHTTVMHPNGERPKVRIRTSAMNDLAEIGILARWQYADTWWTPELTQSIDDMLEVVQDNLQDTIEERDVPKIVAAVVENLSRKEFMVRTPAGDTILLSEGSTGVDFAFKIHTDLGNDCRGVLVNSEPYPLNKPLKDGDRVEVLRGNHHPERIWLDEDLGFVSTAYARSKVRRWFRRLKTRSAVSQGRNLMLQELRMFGIKTTDLEYIAQRIGYASAKELHFDLGRAELLPTELSTQIVTLLWSTLEESESGSHVQLNNDKLVLILGTGGRDAILCQTCQPTISDDIAGYIRRSGDIVVHHTGCQTNESDPLQRRALKLSWADSELAEARIVKIKVDVYDRRDLVLEIAELMHDDKLNMTFMQADTGKGHAQIQLHLQMLSPRQTVRVAHRLMALTNVYSVTCENDWGTVLEPTGESVG